MKAKSYLKSSDFSNHTTAYPFFPRSLARKKVRGFAEKLIKRYQNMFFNVTAMVFTGTVFLGGSYLFFIQLAEYGW